MSYTPTTWQSGDKITSAKLNKIEQGIVNNEIVIETVNGADVSIAAQSNHQYICGELYSLIIVPCQTGICDIIFTSGSSPTVLTIPNTVKMPDWWIGIEPNKIYEINILNGTYGVVMSWDC